MTRIVVVQGESWLETHIRTKYNGCAPKVKISKVTSCDDDEEDSENAPFGHGGEFEFDEE